YCDQGSKSHAERIAKQKKKITTDLGKLKKNKDFWVQTLQNIKLTRWSLIVPSYDDKEVLTHARVKAASLAKEGLPFLDKSFQGFVETPADFKKARAYLDDPTLVSRCLAPKAVTAEQITELVDKKPNFISNLDRKLPRAILNPDAKSL